MLPINSSLLKTHHCYAGENDPKYIVIHETDNYREGAGARAHALAHYNGNLGSASVHYYVDDKEIYQTLNHEDGPWALGDNEGYSDITNKNSINIEICVNEDSDYYKARQNAIELSMFLVNTLGLSVSRVKRHYDASGKWCPRRILDEKYWESLIDLIRNKTDERAMAYVITRYLPKAYEGYNGVDLSKILQYFNGVKYYVRGDSKGVWIETQFLPVSKCLEIKNLLGELFYSIEQK